MSREGLIQLACLYGPLLGAGLLAWRVRPSKRLATGLVFSLAWVLALLPWLDAIARSAGLWTYHSISLSLAGMPLTLYFGWAIAWGLFAPLLARVIGGSLWITAALMMAVDFRVMPEMVPILELNPAWWMGEFGIVSLLLVPALFMTSWTERQERIGLRCIMLVPTFGGIFIGIPLLILCGGIDGIIERWNGISMVARACFVLGGIACSIPGLTAVRDLARSGDGTPVPLDPPLRLVTHGVYAFVRNPMQISMTLLLLLESLFVGSMWPAGLALIGVVYSEGLARWSESEDMLTRFGSRWSVYHDSVRPWLPRWYPNIGDPCELWLDTACEPCSEVARWFERRCPRQLLLRNAGDREGSPLRRVTWRDPASGRTESGVAAISMALQHLDLFWATIGWIAGLPGVSHILQICLDAAGAGERRLE